MRKLFFIIIFILFCNFNIFAKETTINDLNKSKIEQIAKFKADVLRKQLLLNKRQYNKIYRIYIKHENMQLQFNEKLDNKTNNSIKKILNDAQTEKYEDMQKYKNIKHDRRQPHHNYERY